MSASHQVAIRPNEAWGECSRAERRARPAPAADAPFAASLNELVPLDDTPTERRTGTREPRENVPAPSDPVAADTAALPPAAPSQPAPDMQRSPNTHDRDAAPSDPASVPLEEAARVASPAPGRATWGVAAAEAGTGRIEGAAQASSEVVALRSAETVVATVADALVGGLADAAPETLHGPGTTLVQDATADGPALPAGARRAAAVGSAGTGATGAQAKPVDLPPFAEATSAPEATVPGTGPGRSEPDPGEATPAGQRAHEAPGGPAARPASVPGPGHSAVPGGTSAVFRDITAGAAPPVEARPEVSHVAVPDLPVRIAHLAAGARPDAPARMVVRLDPPSLGHLDIDVQAADKTVSVRVVAQTAEACALLADQRSGLRDELQRQGLDLRAFSATIADGSGGDRREHRGAQAWGSSFRPAGGRDDRHTDGTAAPVPVLRRGSMRALDVRA